MTFKRFDCPNCQGEGYVLFEQQGGQYSRYSQSFEQQECRARCETCQGEGSFEVCAHCLSALYIENGQEVCACLNMSLPKAA